MKALGKVSSDDEINQLFDESAEGPAYEQVVNSSQWPIDTKYTMSNLEALKSLLVWEKLFEKRERQIMAIREGLEFIGLLPFICLYPDLTSAFFIDKEIPLTSEVMNTVINWQRLTAKNEQEQNAAQWLREFVDSCSSSNLKMLLKFATSFCVVNSLIKPTNDPPFTLADKMLPQASACCTNLLIPLGNDSTEQFFQNMIKALEDGCIGYGNM